MRAAAISSRAAAASYAQAERVRRGQERALAASLLAPAHGLAIPSLAGVPASYVVRKGGTIPMARALVVAAVADLEDWDASKGAAAFVERTLQRWIDQDGGSRLVRHLNHQPEAVWVHANITDSMDKWCGPESEGVGYLLIDAGFRRQVSCAAASSVLEAVHPRLPVSVFRMICSSLFKACGVYDWWDTLYRAEWQAENASCEAEEDGDGDVDATPIPDDTSREYIPEPMKRKPLRRGECDRIRAALRDDHPAAIILDASVKLLRMSRALECPGSLKIDLNADWGPHADPMFVLHWTPNDDIIGVFDADMDDRYNAGEPSRPGFIAEFAIGSPKSVRRARAAFKQAIAMLLQAEQLFDHVECVTPVTVRPRVRVRAARPLVEVLA